MPSTNIDHDRDDALMLVAGVQQSANAPLLSDEEPAKWRSLIRVDEAVLRPLPGLEIIGQFILAFADQINLPLAESRDTSDPEYSTGCGLGEECILGWEADLALKISWGPNDEMRWSNEFGIMNAGPALGPRLTNSLIWTLQTRIAFVY